jgi:enoyl-CoA hydratase/carnithine racemase
MGGPVAGWSNIAVSQQGRVTVCTLNRPHRMNAVNAAMNRELAEFWRWVRDDPEQRVAVVTGAGDQAFCSGADVTDTLDGEDVSKRPDDVLQMLEQWVPHDLAKPLICAVNGVCAGGGLHFVGGADFTIASERATFLDPHVSVGHVSGIETIELTYCMPVPTVLRMALLGRHESMDAARALQAGLVTEVVPAERLLPRAIELAILIARNSPAAVRRTREAIRGSLGRPRPDAYRQGWQLICDHAATHPDAAEGPRAFREKRSPIWSADHAAGS